MVNIIIIHGAYGNPEENWFPYLKKELESLGHNVYIPKFPTPDDQSLDSWIKVFENYSSYLNDETILIGHSLGPAFILNVLEKSHTKIKVAFFISGFTGLLNHDIDKINHTFTDKNFNWNKIKNNCSKFYLINSDNDPYVPLIKGSNLAEKLDATFIVLQNAGHINSAAGFDTFPLLLELVKKEL
jgi:hypothetical protein